VKEDYDHIEQDLKNAATLMANMDHDINDGDSAHTLMPMQ
jgi:hypothetical protein